MNLRELTKGLNIMNSPDFVDIEITSIEYDSRKVKEGSLFVAIEGFETDGHKYIHSAIKNGAAAIVCQKDSAFEGAVKILVENSRKALALLSAEFFSHPASKMKIIGITGTNGKTTTTYLVKEILEYKDHKVGLIGTNQNMIGNRVIESSRTTPESLELHKLFYDMYSEGVEYVIMEVSSHSLYLDRVYGIDFEIGAFTNLTRDHLDFHKTMDNYAMAKAILFSMCKVGIINSDDEYAHMITKNALCKTIRYAVRSKADIVSQNIKLSSKGVNYDVLTPLTKENIRVNIPGDFSVYNSLCAIGICLALGISISDIKNALVIATGVKGRAEIVNIPSDYTVMIDYAHTPDGLENIIKTVKGFAKGRVITMFGCGGDRDRTKRPIMGRISGELSDVTIITSDNPRTENPDFIISEIEEGIKKTQGEYHIIPQRKEAIRYAMHIAKADDIVLLAGKGHETYQILNTGTIHFDEREIVKEIFEQSNR